jgi:DNA-binding CsgD family transcriptional regulator
VVRVRNRQLVLCDRRASAELDAFIDQLRTTPDTAALQYPPIVVQRGEKRPLVLRILPVDGAARAPFLGARALLLLLDLNAKLSPDPAVVARAFGLSPAETRLASLIAGGSALERAAEELGVSRETARNQLKSVFAKTDTHRQAELVALLARLRRPSD